MFKWADEAHMEEFDLVAATIEKELMELKQDFLDLKKDIGEIIVVLESIRAKF
ncbi:unnamed protein product [Brassica oleracea var. botrytis]